MADGLDSSKYIQAGNCETKCLNNNNSPLETEAKTEI